MASLPWLHLIAPLLPSHVVTPFSLPHPNISWLQQNCRRVQTSPDAHLSCLSLPSSGGLVQPLSLTVAPLQPDIPPHSCAFLHPNGGSRMHSVPLVEVCSHYRSFLLIGPPKDPLANIHLRYAYQSSSNPENYLFIEYVIKNTALYCAMHIQLPYFRYETPFHWLINTAPIPIHLFCMTTVSIQGWTRNKLLNKLLQSGDIFQECRLSYPHLEPSA